MSAETPNKHVAKTPIHLWMVGTIFMVIYGVGIYDYLMVQAQNVMYLNSLNVKGDVVAYFTGYPFLLKIPWGINVFSGLMAAVLLLLRKKQAVGFALLAGLAKLVLDIATFTFLGRWEVFGMQASLIDLSILVLTFLLVVYCTKMLKQGVLG
ncbi:hypothetical protein A6395_04630 [Exiguobacterium sp. SH31]|nr:hypothetical protein [Exiguobacterium sp. SH31]OGX79892.1 hypothetical protein A6395_04630 [Exiguobacterium sp. SH31]TCI73510.1 hypothetical protein EVJ22_03690 [Exiguobacterium sp. SH0S7]